jgi:hypothetical protein
MPTPDPPPPAVTPDPPPEAATPPAAVKSVLPDQSQRAQATSRPAVAPPPTRRQQSRVRPAVPRPKAKPKRQVVAAQAVIRDSAPMPRSLFSPAAEAIKRGLLVTAGVALVVVALGGGVVLVASRRALAGARA